MVMILLLKVENVTYVENHSGCCYGIYVYMHIIYPEDLNMPGYRHTEKHRKIL